MGEDTQNCITTVVDKLLKTIDNKPFDTIVATIRMRKNPPSEYNERDTFYHMIFHTRSNYVTVMGGEGEFSNPQIDDKFRLQARHDSCWRSDGFQNFNKISKDMNKTWLVDMHFINLNGNIDWGTDEWNSNFTFNMFDKSITRID